jgi:gluconate 2-dehydrogenase gamma chain
MQFHRRDLLASTAVLLLSASISKAGVISGQLPWEPYAGDPPTPVRPGPWQYFTAAEVRTIEAIADRIIPPDSETPGGKDAGCAVYIDRQLAGPYGHNGGHYTRPPFQKGMKQQGPQSKNGPAQQYRVAIAAIDKHCREKYQNKNFADLSDAEKDDVLNGVESGDVKLDPVDAKTFFTEHLLKNMQEGFFADPIYGGNRDMAGWKMIGFPGTRYNYLDWIDRHNERFPLPPVSMIGRAEWTAKKS